MTRILIKTIEIEIDPGQPIAQLLREALHGYPMLPTQTTLETAGEPVRALATGLDEQTARCESCGCTWDTPCRGGCAWDPDHWAKGRAVCTACLRDVVRTEGPSAEALPESRVKNRKTPAGKVAKERKAPRRTPARASSAEVKGSPQKGSKTSEKSGGGGRTAQAEEIRRRIKAGESNAEIAEALGVTEAGVSYHRRKLAVPGLVLGAGGRKKVAKASKEPQPAGEDHPRIRCRHCGQTGVDPKRCDHCQEKR